jgi:hypothetical protein
MAIINPERAAAGDTDSTVPLHFQCSLVQVFSMLARVVALILVVVNLQCVRCLLVRPSMWQRTSILKCTLLTVGDNVQISQLDNGPAGCGKYRADGHVCYKDLYGYIREYKDEMKRKRVIIPGFRPGVVPAHAMPEIRSFVVNYAVENVLKNLCNVNELRVRTV